MAKLLREFYELCEGGVCQDLLTESEKRFVKEGGMMLTGKLQEAGVLNGNKRMYPEGVLKREVQRYKGIVDDNRALGELDHPDSSIVNLANVSHMVTDIWMEGPAVMGKCKVLETPSGQILRALVESGVKIGISSRGMGSVSEGACHRNLIFVAVPPPSPDVSPPLSTCAAATFLGSLGVSAS